MARKYFTIIHNPTAGRRSAPRLAAVIAAVEAGGGVATVHATRACGHATALARQAVGHADVVVAAGGDGTLNEVAAGLLGSAQVMGLIPLGTANVAAHDMGLADLFGVSWRRVAHTLIAGRPRPLCVGEVRAADGWRALFLMMVGIGFDAASVAAINPRLKRRWGKLAYVWAGCAAWREYRPGALKITASDGRSAVGQWAIISNGRYFAGHHRLDPDGDLFAPILRAFVIRQPGRGALTLSLARLSVGQLHRDPHAQILESQHFEIDSLAEVQPVQRDGEMFGTTPVTVALLPERIAFLTPSGIKS
ncbi:MAG: diacylglycerol/lipid kinase family protein [Pseudomonadota bacterium]